MEIRPIRPLNEENEKNKVPAPPVPNRARTEMSSRSDREKGSAPDEIKLPPHTTPDPGNIVHDVPAPQVGNCFLGGSEGASLGNFVADMSDDMAADGIESFSFYNKSNHLDL